MLAYMYNLAIIHAIVTLDSDYWALLDDPCVFLNLMADLRAHVCFGRGCLLGRSADGSLSPASIEQVDAAREEPSHNLNRFGAIVRATIYGNDYVTGVRGIGEKPWSLSWLNIQTTSLAC